MEDLLFVSCRAGHGDTVRRLLSQGVAVNVRDSVRKTPLILAAKHGHVDIVELILDHGADVDDSDRNGQSALTMACANGHYQIVMSLMRRGADCNTTDMLENTPLKLACKAGHDQIVNVLIEHGADVNMTCGSRSSALTVACIDGYVKVIEALIEHGADVNHAAWRGCTTPLIEACSHGNRKIVEILIEHGADVNLRNGETPLMTACMNGNFSIIETLIEHGADVMLSDTDGNVSLEAACHHKNVKSVKLLIEHGADVNARGYGGRTALMAACCKGHEDVVDILLEHGADVNDSSWTGFTALISACCAGSSKIVRKLIGLGADVNACITENGFASLSLACREGYGKMLKPLLEHGADVNARDDSGNTALMQASQFLQKKNYSLARETSHIDSDVLDDLFGVQDEYYRLSDLNFGSVKCLRTLLLAGSNPDLANKNGHTVFTLALRSNDTKFLRCLLGDRNLSDCEGRLKRVHRNAHTTNVSTESLLVTIVFGVFEWHWCRPFHFKPVSLAAMASGCCPGTIRCNANLNISPMVLSLLVNDSKLTQTFLSRLYYFPKDYRLLTTDKSIRRRIRNKAILEDITHHPMSLQTWSFLTVSYSICLAGPPAMRCQRVDSLPIPDIMKAKLNFK